MPLSRLLVVLAALAIAITACGGSTGGDTTAVATTAVATDSTAATIGGFGSDAIAIRASSDIGVGAERLLVGVRSTGGAELGSPGVPVTFLVAPIDAPEETQQLDTHFIWIIPEHTGLYAATVEFDRPGTWAIQVVPDDGEALDAVPFTVLEETSSPGLGDPAPASVSLTLDDGSLDDITTDPEPEEGFYQMTVAEAVGSGATSVIVFATPAYCRTAACGPMLRQVKELAPAFPDVNFVHVEVYVGLQEEGFTPDADHLAPAVIEWALPSEPWIFVVDGDGIVTARFEGVLGVGELESYID